MDLQKEFAKFNIDTFGVCDASLYNKETGASFNRCIVALFPYFCGYPEKHNISIYAHGKDYHLVTRRILDTVAKNMGLGNYTVNADTGPEIERELCIRAGLAFRGRNGMCINHKYGSYFFIGYIACNGEFEISKPLEDKCLNCMKCVKHCPGDALREGFNCDRCISHITQKRGQLTPWEEDSIKRGKSVFGCDVCQRVCPHNRSVSITPIIEFKEDTIVSLQMEDIQNLTNKTFKEKYGDRAFAWRGKGVIERNIGLINTMEETEDENSNS